MNKYKNTLTGKINYLLGHHDEDRTHLYHLTRVKEAFNIGTMTLDDFVEVDENLTEELVELFLEENQRLIEENQQCENDKQLYLARSEYYESETERLKEEVVKWERTSNSLNRMLKKC